MPDDRPRRALPALLDELDRALGLQDLRLAVARQVVGQGLHLAEALLGLGLGEPDGGDLGLAVGDARDARLVDHRRVEPGDVLGDEDALLEAAVGELQAGDDVAERVDVRQVRAQPLVGEDEAALHRHAGLLVAVPGGVRAAADRDEQQVRLDVVARLERHRHRVLGLLGAGELHAGLERRSCAGGRPAPAAWRRTRPRWAPAAAAPRRP